MRVLAIDPGYGRCGVAVLEKSTIGREIILYSDCIETPAGEEFSERLRTVTQACRELVRQYQPSHLAMEKLYFQKNQKTAMRVAEVRGALLQLAADSALEVTEYAPGEVKAAVTGDGRADKHAVAKILHALVRISKRIEHDDEYDAIAIGVTHFALINSRSRLAALR